MVQNTMPTVHTGAAIGDVQASSYFLDRQNVKIIPPGGSDRGERQTTINYMKTTKSQSQTKGQWLTTADQPGAGSVLQSAQNGPTIAFLASTPKGVANHQYSLGMVEITAWIIAREHCTIRMV